MKIPCAVKILLLLVIIFPLCTNSQKPMETTAVISYINKDFPIEELNNENWQAAKQIAVDRYWSGQRAPNGRHFSARLLWSDTALYVRFEARQDEPLVVSEKPGLKSKTMNLWDRDVCEIFLAPDKNDPNRYFEFEVAPTGEWVDVGIRVTPKGRESDWKYSSGMQTASRIEKDRVVMAMKIEWKAFGKQPTAGEVWLGNLLRCVGKDPDRGYLTWRPTKTETPNFHVPEAFGEFVFLA